MPSVINSSHRVSKTITGQIEKLNKHKICQINFKWTQKTFGSGIDINNFLEHKEKPDVANFKYILW